MNNKVLVSVAAHAYDRIDDCVGVVGCDLHNEVFNSDYFVVYHSSAVEYLESWGVDAFQAIDYVKDYEVSNFGKFTTKIDPVSIVNMVAYIAGEELFGKIELISDLWDDALTVENCEQIKKELEEYFVD